MSVYEQIRKGTRARGPERVLVSPGASTCTGATFAKPSPRRCPHPAKRPRPGPHPRYDPWKPVVEGWLEEDKKAPRKQRHSARRVWQRPQDEHGAELSEPTGRRFVAEVPARQELALADVAVPEHHPLGAEAEVDFGTATVVLAGAATEVQLFIMRLSASGPSLPTAYLNEGQEVFLDSHVRAFSHFGGAPARIRPENVARNTFGDDDPPAGSPLPQRHAGGQ